jgi:phosphoribosylformylglycinamidine (FGAM) synthase PurS component
VQARSDALDVQLFGAQHVLDLLLGYINHISSTDSNFIVDLGINADKNQTVQQVESAIQATQANTNISSYSLNIINTTRASDLQAVIQYGHYPYQLIHN